MFNAVAKLATAEKTDDGWVANESQASRYATICKSMKADKIKVADAAKHLKGRTRASFFKPSTSNGTSVETLKRYKDGMKCLEEQNAADNNITVDSNGQIKFEANAGFVHDGTFLALVKVNGGILESVVNANEKSKVVDSAVRRLAEG